MATLVTIDPGTFRHRIALQTQSSTPDLVGQPQLSWTTVATAWASIRALTQREQFAAGQLAAQSTHLITTRYQPITLRAGMRVQFGSRTYEVQAADNVEQRNVYFEIQVIQINGAA